MSPLLMLALAGTALAQSERGEIPATNVQTWSPRVENGGMLWTNDAKLAPSGYVMAGAVVSYQSGALQYEYGDGSVVDLLGSALQIDVLGSVTLGKLRLGLDLPVHAMATGEGLSGGAGTGDLAADVKFGLVDHTRAPLGVALGTRLVLPTASVEAPLGDDGVGWEIAAYTHRQQGPILVALNLGHRMRPAAELENVTLGSELFGRLGFEYSLSRDAGFSAELGAASAYSEGLTGLAAPAQGIVGAWVRPKNPLTVRLGVGTGFSEAIGAPAIRVISGVAYEPRPAVDTDEDGRIDDDDACPFEPEDFDGFEDEDGCPESDNDKDGLNDEEDKCPVDAEDMDTYEDEDGCPEDTTWAQLSFKDPDGGLPEKISAFVTVDDQPKLVANAEKIALEPGTYTVEASGEGYGTMEAQFTVIGSEMAIYEFTLEPPDTGLRITVLNEEGLPLEGAFWWTPGIESSDVQHGVEIAMAAGTHDVYVGADGYAMNLMSVDIADDQVTDLRLTLAPTKLEVTDSQIKMKEKVFFDTGQATIREESFSMLEEVAAVLGAHPEIVKIRVEGHTDSRGNAETNRKLSQSRAESVATFLRERGVADDRMQAVGFGEDHPLDEANTEAAWEINRRVDIFILERAGE